MENQKKSIIESLLFVWGEPLSIRKIAGVLELPTQEARRLVNELMEEYCNDQRGIRIIETNGHYQFSSFKDNYLYIEKLCTTTKSRGLSQSTLETLAIVAYKQPITKGEIEKIRGVKSDKSIQTLIERNLVEEKGRLERIGKPIIYGTTLEFLRAFGLANIRELPEITSFENFEIFMQEFEFEGEEA